MQQSRYYRRKWKILALSTGKCWALIDTDAIESSKRFPSALTGAVFAALHLI